MTAGSYPWYLHSIEQMSSLWVFSLQNYTNCSCISENGLEGFAKPGTCGTSCSHLFLPFVVLSCLAGILASTSHTPSFMLILR